MKFYILRDYLDHDENPQHQVYVNLEDFDNEVERQIEDALRHRCTEEADEIEQGVRSRTATVASLAEVENLLEQKPNGDRTWHEAGRAHDGKAGIWEEANYRGGNAELYRNTAASLRTANDKTMGYDQRTFHSTSLPKTLGVEKIEPRLRQVTDDIATSVQACETAACVAGHAYVCAFGWQAFLQAAVLANGSAPTPRIGERAGAALGMSIDQQTTLFSSVPELDEIKTAFKLTTDDWPCPESRVEEIDTRWMNSSHHCRPEDMSTVLEALARRCDRVNAFIAGIEN